MCRALRSPALPRHGGKRGSPQGGSPPGPRRCAPRAARTVVILRFSLIALGGSEETAKQAGREASPGQPNITARGVAYRRGPSNSTARLRPVQDAAIDASIGLVQAQILTAFRFSLTSPTLADGRHFSPVSWQSPGPACIDLCPCYPAPAMLSVPCDRQHTRIIVSRWRVRQASTKQPAMLRTGKTQQ